RMNRAGFKPQASARSVMRASSSGCRRRSLVAVRRVVGMEAPKVRFGGVQTPLLRSSPAGGGAGHRGGGGGVRGRGGQGGGGGGGAGWESGGWWAWRLRRCGSVECSPLYLEVVRQGGERVTVGELSGDWRARLRRLVGEGRPLSARQGANGRSWADSVPRT